MQAARTLRPRNPNLNYHVVKRTRSSSMGSTHSKRRSKPKPIEGLDAANKLSPSPATPSSAREALSPPSLYLQKLFVDDPASSSDSGSESDSDTEPSSSVALPLRQLCTSNSTSTSTSTPSTSSLDFYKNKMKDLAETYREMMNRGRSSPTQTQTQTQTQNQPIAPSPLSNNPISQSSSSSPPLPSSKRRSSSSRHSQEDIHNANLLLFLGMLA